jgi:2-dehydro-3-deoxy-D-arabinonate dehydratase
MKIFRLGSSVVIEDQQGNQYLKNVAGCDEYINRDDLYAFLQKETASAQPLVNSIEEPVLHPVVGQEVWAAGVTYLRSRDARKEESKDSGGASFYDMVYEAERPEIFFKANANRVVSPDGMVRIRKDSTWNVPEPELVFFITTSGKIVGYTVGNDMSSRSIEGENPLYLPQVKVYDGCAALGPCIYVPEHPIENDTMIHIDISRGGTSQYSDRVAISKMKRGHEELVSFLYRECSFSSGCFLMTGTCMVPRNSFTLESGDEITITIDKIGTLKNMVA